MIYFILGGCIVEDQGKCIIECEPVWMSSSWESTSNEGLEIGQTGPCISEGQLPSFAWLPSRKWTVSPNHSPFFCSSNWCFLTRWIHTEAYRLKSPHTDFLTSLLLWFTRIPIDVDPLTVLASLSPEGVLIIEARQTPPYYLFSNEGSQGEEDQEVEALKPQEAPMV